jgi:hypothetical protein
VVEDDPEWIQYFDEAEFLAEVSHCYRDLGLAERAADAAGKALTGSPRSDFFVTMVGAESRLMAGNVEGACAIAEDAVAAGARMRSARVVSYLNSFRKALDVVGHSSELRNLKSDSRAIVCG